MVNRFFSQQIYQNGKQNLKYVGKRPQTSVLGPAACPGIHLHRNLLYLESGPVQRKQKIRVRIVKKIDVLDAEFQYRPPDCPVAGSRVGQPLTGKN